MTLLVAGGLIIGFIALSQIGGDAGVLGGFTTFSAFSLDTLMLWERGQPGLALVYVMLSVAASLLAVFAGLALGRSILA